MKTSAIIVSGNDNYGGTLIEQATFCLRTMVETFDEVIYVDWNSEGKTLIDEVRGNLTPKGNLKYIVITPEMAERLIGRVPKTPYNNKREGVQKCVEVLGRNIAIRRTTGDVIVSTNIDIIPPPRESTTYFLQKIYNQDSFYTFARNNVDPKYWHSFSYKQSEELRAYLIKNKLKFPETRLINREKWIPLDKNGDFQLAHRDIWHSIKGFEETMLYRGSADNHVQLKILVSGRELKPVFKFALFHLDHPKSQSLYLNDEAYYFLKDNRTTHNADSWGFADINFEMKRI